MRSGFGDKLWGANTHTDLHVPEPADIPEAAALLPQRADGFIAQSGFTVPEGTVVSL